MNTQLTTTLHTGALMPVMGLGTWELLDDTSRVVAHALEHGYSMVDTSGDYGTQAGVGEALQKSAVAREGVYIVTKVEEDEDSYEATARNLSELQLAYVDLILIHRPPKSGVGEALYRGLMRARDEGFVRDVGVSNFSAKQLRDLIDATGDVPVVNQIEWSPFGHSDDMLNFAKEHEIVIQAYSPLTRGEKLAHEMLEAMAVEYDKTPAQILIRWNIQRGTVPIPKANSLPHLEENIDIFDFEIREDDMLLLSGLNEHYSALGELPYI